MQKLSFVIPCYNSTNTLEIVVNEIIAKVEDMKIHDYEIILVCDYSPDNTFELIRKLCYSNKKIKGINLSKNFGQHCAMMAGFSIVTGDIVIDIDDDGQLPVDELPKLLEMINADYDVVVGKFQKDTTKGLRAFGTKINDIMASLLINKPKELEFTSFIVMKKFVVDEIIKYQNPYPYLTGLILQTTSRIMNVDVKQRERLAGKTNYSLRKLISLWINGFTAFSVKPLRIATVVGLIISLFGFIGAVYTFIHKIINPDVAVGWSSLMIVVAVIGGINLIMLGLIGEYVGRMYISMNNSPQYVIKEKINIDSDHA